MKKILGPLLALLTLVSLTPVTAYCIPEGSWSGTGTAILDDGKARTCEKMNLQIYFVNGTEYDFEMSAQCEGIYSETPPYIFTTRDDDVLLNSKVVGSFKDQKLLLNLPLDPGYSFEFSLLFGAQKVDLEQKLLFNDQEVQRSYKGSLKK